MRIIAKKKLEEFGKKYADAVPPLRAWYQEVKEANWSCFEDVTNHFNTADLVKGEVVIFNICGNKYRLAVKVWFPGREVYIKFFGTHTEYDRTNMREL